MTAYYSRFCDYQVMTLCCTCCCSKI